MDAQQNLNELSRLILKRMRKVDFIRILTYPIWIQDMKFINHLHLYDNKVCDKPFVRFHRIERIYAN